MNVTACKFKIMSAGDLLNNLGKLELKLKQVNFRNFRRFELLAGNLDTYISIYGYVFSDFNRELSKLIVSYELELYGKTSKRFVDNLYLIVRDILRYKPPITKDKFLSKCGFVEMKMIMCTQILELVLAKCKELPSSEKKKNCRKPGEGCSSFPSATGIIGGKNNINVSTKHPENANNVTTSSKVMSDDRKCEPPTCKTKSKQLSSCRHQSSNHLMLAESRVSSKVIRHSNSNDCAIAKNPVSKCNVARTSYSKGKAVVLEKQEPPSQKIETKVLKGPLQIDDGFSGALTTIPSKESSSPKISFSQNSFPRAKSLVFSNPKTSARLSTSMTNAAMRSCAVTTSTTVPRSTENAVTRTAPKPESAVLSFSTSSTITKSRNTCPAPSTAISISTSTSKLKCPPKDAVPAKSKFVENTTVTMLKPSGENDQLKKIDLLTSSCSPAVVPTTIVADVEKLKDSERTQAEKALSQIKYLSQNISGFAETLRQMQERSKHWDARNSFLNRSEQNKENSLITNKGTIPIDIWQESVDVSRTKKSEDQAHQLNYWIAKMNLMECSVKSLESKFKSL